MALLCIQVPIISLRVADAAAALDPALINMAQQATGLLPPARNRERIGFFYKGFEGISRVPRKADGRLGAAYVFQKTRFANTFNIGSS